jgi:hypothetical protein
LNVGQTDARLEVEALSSRNGGHGSKGEGKEGTEKHVHHGRVAA